MHTVLRKSYLMFFLILNIFVFVPLELCFRHEINVANAFVVSNINIWLFILLISHFKSSV